MEYNHPIKTSFPTRETLFRSILFLTRSNLFEKVRDLGIEARLVTFDFENNQIPCAGFGGLRHVDPLIMLKVLKLAFKPSTVLATLISTVTMGLEDADNGVCVHHRDGKDWYDHCDRWSSIPDGVYRGNCLGVPGRTFLQSLQSRGLTGKDRWVYYCGDHDVPAELQQSEFRVHSRKEVMSEETTRIVESFSPEGKLCENCGRSLTSLYVALSSTLLGTASPLSVPFRLLFATETVRTGTTVRVFLSLPCGMPIKYQLCTRTQK